MAYADATPCAVDQGRAFTDATFSRVANERNHTGRRAAFRRNRLHRCGRLHLHEKQHLHQRYTKRCPLRAWIYGDTSARERQLRGRYCISGTISRRVAKDHNSSLLLKGSAPIDQCSVTWSDQSTTPQTTSTAFRVLGEETVTFSDIVHCGRQKVGADFNYTCTHVQHVTADSECYANATWIDKDTASPDSSAGANRYRYVTAYVRDGRLDGRVQEIHRHGKPVRKRTHVRDERLSRRLKSLKPIRNVRIDE